MLSEDKNHSRFSRKQLIYSVSTQHVSAQRVIISLARMEDKDIIKNRNFHLLTVARLMLARQVKVLLKDLKNIF
jgi:hypothetical protein